MSAATKSVAELVPDAGIIGSRVELDYASHRDAMAALCEIRSRLEQRDELLAALQAIYRELAWDQLPPYKRSLADNARAAIAKATGGGA